MLRDFDKERFGICAAVLAHTNAMLAYWDKDLICRFANDAYLQWFGVSPDDMIDKMTLEQLLGPVYKINLPYIYGALQGVEQIFERDIPLPSGQVRYALATYTPHWVNEAVEGFFVHVADITPVKNRYRVNVLKTTVSGGAVLTPAGQVLESIVQTLKSSILTGFPGIAKLAATHFVSESKLKRDFKLVYGTSIFSFFRSLQMEWAYNCVLQKQYNIKQMAAMLQFANPSNFSACYHKHVRERESKLTIAHLLNANDERYKTFIAQSPFAIAMLNSELNYLAVSQKYVQEYHLYDTPLLGISQSSVFGQHNEKWNPIYQACLHGQILNGEEQIIEKDKPPRWLRWDIRPWYKNNNVVGGILIFSEDITATKIQEVEKNTIFEILDKANEIARIGTWKRNFKTNTGLWGKVTKQILEVPEDFKVDFETGVHFYKEGESRDLVINSVRNALEKGEPFDVEVDVITAKGNAKRVRVIGYPEFKSGKCERLFGIFQEIPQTHAQ